MKKIIISLILCLAPCLAPAADMDPFTENFNFELGYFLPKFSSNTRVDNAQTNRGTDLNLEDRLNLPKETTSLYASVTWRYWEKHRIQIGMFEFNRSGHRSIDEEIEIGDKTYPIGADLDTNFKVRVIPIQYMYSFIQTSDLEFAGYIGLQWSSISLNVFGSVTTNPAEIDRTSAADAEAPMPVLGVDTKYFINHDWSVGANLGAFIYNIGASGMSYKGSVATATVDTAYWFSEYVGAGAAINAFYFTVDVEANHWKGKLDYSYWGPQIYLTARF